MRALLFLLSFLLALPGVALAAIFLIIGNAIGTHSLFGFLAALLHTFVGLMPWGLLALLVAGSTLLIAGFSDRLRWLASVSVAALAVASSAVVLVMTIAHDNFGLDQLPFHVPAALSAMIGIGLAWRERPRLTNAVAKPVS